MADLASTGDSQTMDEERAARSMRWFSDRADPIPSGGLVVLSEPGFLPSDLPSLEGSPVRTVIVTTEEQAEVWEELAAWKTLTGEPTVVRTVDELLSHYEGVDSAEKLRNFHRHAREHWGTEVILLAGDAVDVPVRYCHSWAWNQPVGVDILCDYYFACLDGSWNADGDGVFGEPIHATNPLGDGADMEGMLDLVPDVHFGRIPARDARAAKDFLDKYFVYTRSPTRDGHLSNIMLIGEVLFMTGWLYGDCDTCSTCPGEICVTMDGVTTCERVVEEIVAGPSGGDVEFQRYYERHYIWEEIYPNVFPTTMDGITGAVEAGANILFHVGHGDVDRWKMGSDPQSHEEIVFTTEDISLLTNAAQGRPIGLAHSIDCNSAAIDLDCFATAWLEDPDGGGVAFIGTTNLDFPVAAESFAREFYEELYQNEATSIGEAYYKMMERRALAEPVLHDGRDNSRRFVLYGHTLLADPTMQLWLVEPEPLALDFPHVVPLGQDRVTVAVTRSGNPVEEARVTLQKGSESYAVGLTDVQGKVSLPLLAETTGSFDVGATAYQSIPTTGKGVVVSSPTPSLSVSNLELLDDGSGESLGNGNSEAELGETIVVGLTLENNGSSPAVDCEAVLRWEIPTWEDVVDLEDDHADFGDIPPGEESLDPRAFRIRIPRIVPPEMEDELGGGDQMNLDLAVDLSFEGGSRTYGWTLMATQPLLIPHINTVDDDSLGDGDGVAENGEIIALDVGMWNRGLGTASFLEGTILAEPPDAAEILVGEAVADEILPGETGLLGPFGLLINDVEALTLRLFIRDVLPDDDPVVAERSIELIVPDSVDSLFGVGKPASVSLFWELPQGEEENVYAARVYRAPGARDLFEPVAPLVLGATYGPSYFGDEGLAPLTRYQYRVALVDSSGNEGAWSDVFEVSTTPGLAEGWPNTVESTSRSSPTVTQLDGSGEHEILFGAEVIYAFEGSGAEYHDGDHDPTTEGPLTEDLSEAPNRGDIWCKIATWDLDGDGDTEVVATARDGAASDPLDGILAVFDALGQEIWRRELGRFLLGSPSLGQLDADPEYEVAVANSNKIYAFNHDGSSLTDSPGGVLVTLPEAVNLYQTVCLADIDGDELDEAILVSWNGNDRTRPPWLWAVNGDGTNVDGFPVDLSTVGEGSSLLGNTGGVVAADLDQDGHLELAFLTGKRFWIFEHDGAKKLASPPRVAFGSGGSGLQTPAIGDLNRDGILEVVFALKWISGVTLHALRGTATEFGDAFELEGFPVTLEDDVNIDPGSPILANMNGDDRPEIVIGDANGRIHCHSFAGEAVPGFPVDIRGGDLRYGGLAGWDVDRNGYNNLIAQAWDDRDLFVFDLSNAPFPDDSAEIAAQNPWPMKHHDPRNTGFAGSELMVTGAPNAPGEGDEEEVRVLAFRPNRPNPFAPRTLIRFQVPGNQPVPVEIRICDVGGRVVRRLFSGRVQPGPHELEWDARNDLGEKVSSGLYLATLRSQGEERHQKLLLLK